MQPLHSRGQATGLLAAHRQPDNMRGWLHMHWEQAIWRLLVSPLSPAFGPLAVVTCLQGSSCDSELQAQHAPQHCALGQAAP